MYGWYQFGLCFISCVVFLVVVGSIAMAHCRILALLHLSSWLSLSSSMLWNHSAAIIQTRGRVNPYCFLLCFWKSIMKGESWNILALCFNKSYLKKANLKSTRRNSHATAHKAYHFRSICQWCFVFFGQFTQINWSLNVPRVVCCSTSYFPELPSLCMYHFNPECSLGLLGPLLFF